MFVHYLSSEPLSCYLHQTDFPCLDFVPVFSIFCNSNGWISFTPSLTSLAFHVQCFDQLTKTSEITQKGQGDTSWAKHIFWELLPWFKQKTSTIVHIAIWYFTTLSPHLSMNYKTLLSLLTSPSTVQKQNLDDIGQEKKNKKKNLSEKENRQMHLQHSHTCSTPSLTICLRLKSSCPYPSPRRLTLALQGTAYHWILHMPRLILDHCNVDAGLTKSAHSGCPHHNPGLPCNLSP